jgi:hypothetical protein
MFSMASCTKEIDIEQGSFDKKLAIEGYIENGKYAWVILTRNLPFFGEITPNNLTELFIDGSEAVVIVSDDNTSDTLQFEFDPLVLEGKMTWPPVKFVGKKIVGKIGASYQLKVLYEGKEYIATTSITKPYRADTIWFTLENGNDSLGSIHTIIHDNVSEANYYRYYTLRMGKDLFYTPGLMSIWDDRFFNGKDFEVVLWRGQGFDTSYGSDDPDSYFFRLGDTVSIKSCTMDHDSYWFWKTLGSRETLSNIKPEKSALGIWCGYGTEYHTFICNNPSK